MVGTFNVQSFMPLCMGTSYHTERRVKCLIKFVLTSYVLMFLCSAPAVTLPCLSFSSQSPSRTVPPLSCVIGAVRLYISTLPAEQSDQRAKNEPRLTTRAAQFAVKTDFPTLLLTDLSIHWLVSGTHLYSTKVTYNFQNVGTVWTESHIFGI